MLIIVVWPIAGWAAEPAPPLEDPEIAEFSTFASDTSFLAGLFLGVRDYCEGKVSARTLSAAQRRWGEINGVYLDASDDAVDEFVARKIPEWDAARVTQALREQNAGWVRKARSDNRVLASIREADDESIACARTLATLVSASFDIKAGFPDVHRYWQAHLKLNSADATVDQ